MKNLKEFKTRIGDVDLLVKINPAIQANGSCIIQLGETSVLGTAGMSKNKTLQDFFPLTVEYQERFYAAGKILGSRYTRREAKPSTKEILNARVVDRMIRPLFPESLRQETQIILTCLSWDRKNSPVPAATLAGSLALGISDIPWNGPVGCVQIGRINKELVLNPNFDQKEESDFHITLSGVKREGEVLINMIETCAKQIPEDEIFKAMEFALPYIKQLIDFQEEIISTIGKEKQTIDSIFPDKNLEKEIKEILGEDLEKPFSNPREKNIQEEEIGKLKEKVLEILKKKYPEETSLEIFVSSYFERELTFIVHKNVLEKELRPDGRKLNQIRPIECEVSILPRVHGSALFKRGATHAMSIVTLGSPESKLTLEGIEEEEEQRYMHHYNFPPYSSGEVKQMRSLGRREIGHGMLAENAIKPVLPDIKDFPYTIRVVTEILSSNGSTSMASTCGSTLSLMDAGVPLTSPVAGISVGLMSGCKTGFNQEKNKNYKLITDIQGPEDHYGDMDFKVAGTNQGITAIQLDVKIDGLSMQIIKETFANAKEARTKILELITQTIPEPRKELSPWAPMIITTRIPADKIGELIGPKGKNINEIIERFKVEVSVEDDGLVYITSQTKQSAQDALSFIESMFKEYKVGEIVKAKVVRITEFGAFADISENATGLIHISQLSDKRVNKVQDILKIGDIVTAKIISIDPQGKIALSLKETKK
ncbi:MAG TPA: polyribonucleotide nucleotidyltransferase [Candidatus Pacearchaeota archaeon]|nr:polyribonucleotide nucleotidyltransferase [Candidatus Pacearchaeota archaeon]